MEFPLTFSILSIWLAMTAIILIAATELISPYHGQTRLLIEKKRLRKAALAVGMLFLLSVMMQIYALITTR